MNANEFIFNQNQYLLSAIKSSLVVGGNNWNIKGKTKVSESRKVLNRLYSASVVLTGNVEENYSPDCYSSIILPNILEQNKSKVQ